MVMVTVSVEADVDVDLSDFDDEDLVDECERRGLSAVGDPSDGATAIFEAFYCGNETKGLELVRAWVQNETGRVLP